MKKPQTPKSRIVYVGFWEHEQRPHMWGGCGPRVIPTYLSCAAAKRTYGKVFKASLVFNKAPE